MGWSNVQYWNNPLFYLGVKELIKEVMAQTVCKKIATSSTTIPDVQFQSSSSVLYGSVSQYPGSS